MVNTPVFGTGSPSPNLGGSTKMKGEIKYIPSTDYRPIDEHYGPLWEKYNLCIAGIGWNAIQILNDKPLGPRTAKFRANSKDGEEGYRNKIKKKFELVIFNHNTICDYLEKNPVLSKLFIEGELNYYSIMRFAKNMDYYE